MKYKEYRIECRYINKKYGDVDMSELPDKTMYFKTLDEAIYEASYLIQFYDKVFVGKITRKHSDDLGEFELIRVLINKMGKITYKEYKEDK